MSHININHYYLWFIPQHWMLIKTMQVSCLKLQIHKIGRSESVAICGSVFPEQGPYNGC